MKKSKSIEDYIILFIQSNQVFYKSLIEDNINYKEDNLFFMSIHTFAEHLKDVIPSAFKLNYTTGEDTDEIVCKMLINADYEAIAHKIYGEFINISMLVYTQPNNTDVLDIITQYLTSETAFFADENLNY